MRKRISIPPPGVAGQFGRGRGLAVFSHFAAVGGLAPRLRNELPRIDAYAAADGGDDVLAADHSVVDHRIDLGRSDAQLRLRTRLPGPKCVMCQSVWPGRSWLCITAATRDKSKMFRMSA